MSNFKALLLERGDGGVAANWREFTDADLMDGDVTVAVTH